MKKAILSVVVAILIAAGGWWLSSNHPSGPNHHTIPAGKFGVVIVDVGEGDSQLVVTPNHVSYLVDTGDNNEKQSWVNLSQVLEDNHIKNLDYLVITHPHQDHIGNILPILASYTPRHVLLTGVTYTNQTYEKALEFVRGHNIDAMQVKTGSALDIDQGVHIDILAPSNTSASNVNNTSIVSRVSYGDFSILLTGDAEVSEEQQEMATSSELLHVTVLKAGHHGSNTSTSAQFLTVVKPDWVVISAGRDNPYHHPHPSTVNRLKQFGIPALVTMDTGSVTFVSDGKTYTEAQDK